MKKLDIVVPTLNEEANIVKLVKRIDDVMRARDIAYGIIVVDDNSIDRTRAFVEKLSKTYPVSIYVKKGKKGKAFSLLEGFSKSKAEFIAFIDADLQYPPQAIPSMLDMLEAHEADVVVANRSNYQDTKARKLISKSFRYLFGKLLHGLSCDVQSGLKVFRSEIVKRIDIEPTQWTFDLQFLIQARDAGYVIASKDITFKKRKSGRTKVSLFKTSLEIGWEALREKFRTSKMIYLKKNKKLVGFHYKGRKFATYNELNKDWSAMESLTRGQKMVISGLLVLSGTALYLDWRKSLIGLISGLIVLYFTDLLFNLLLVYRSFFNKIEVSISKYRMKKHRSWPKYTILCPLYKESAVIPQFTKAIKALNYPKTKLEVLLLLEEDDDVTIEAIKEANLPKYFHVVVVPDSQPKTKPKACNYGLLKSTGEYAVIYDAEDIPDPDQLKKAVLAFELGAPNLVCVQAKLNYYNSNQNLLTRLFTLEYSLWFDLVLTGLQSIETVIPLGGTSNHFRVKDLHTLGGWDPFNVTEDADLGLRIAKLGYTTAVLDSTTMEEANSDVKNWFRQRSRWIKGYMQTYLVHMRNPATFLRSSKKLNLLAFQMVIGGKILALLINPFMWCLTVVYFSLRALVGEAIESLFLAPIFYLGVFTLVIGNFLYIYYYILGVGKRGRWDLVVYGLFVPVYWLMMSGAAFFALWELLVRPHYWQKTIHGLHLTGTKKKFVSRRFPRLIQPGWRSAFRPLDF